MSIVYIPHAPQRRRVKCKQCQFEFDTRVHGQGEACPKCQSRERSMHWEPVHDLTPALAYGQLEVVFQARFMDIIPQPMVADARYRMRNFTDDDFLLAIGDPVAIAISAAVAAEINNGKFRCLKWDKRTARYIEFAVDIRGRKTS